MGRTAIHKGDAMQLVNLTLRDANAFVSTHHRHAKKVQGHKFSIGVTNDSELVGVAIVGRPVARKLDDGLTAEITRLCVNEFAPRNACSFLYRAAWRAWIALGGSRIVTYTLTSESGSSLKGANFKPVATSQKWEEGKGWTSRDGRAWQPLHSEGKTRWELVCQ